MKRRFYYSLIEETKNPTRVSIGVLSENLYFIGSAKNTNDTVGWFLENSGILEKAFIEADLSWCYVFETAPKQMPMIYLFVGEGLTKEDVKRENRIAMATLPEDRKMFFEKKSFSLIDIDQYDNNITEMEKVAKECGVEINRVYEV